MPPEDPTPPNPAPAPSFSQDDVNRIVAERLKKIGDVDALRAQAAKAAEYEGELARLREEAELAGKSEAEKAKARIEANEKRFRAELESRDKATAEATAKAAAAEAKYRAKVVDAQISSALVESKVHAPAHGTAMRDFLATAEIETDDDHKVTAVTVAGKRFSDVKQAAAAFLEANPFLLAHSGNGGSGSRPGITGGLRGVPLSKLSTEDLIAAGNAQRAATR